jgi:hypothetical protein
MYGGRATCSSVSHPIVSGRSRAIRRNSCQFDLFRNITRDGLTYEGSYSPGRCTGLALAAHVGPVPDNLKWNMYLPLPLQSRGLKKGDR